MIGYILHRIAVMIPTLVIISALVFTIIELPPGDYFETYVAQLQAQGESVDLRQIEFLRQQYGFDRPPIERYFVWVWGMLHGDFGYSFAYELPVRDVVGDRIWLTILVSFVTIIFTWVIAFPIGIYSATHQYSWGDHGLTFLGLIGLATPNFLLALLFMYFANQWFGTSIGGLMDQQYINEPMSWAKFMSIMEHLWIPVIIIGTSGTAGMIRRLRANLLDELAEAVRCHRQGQGAAADPGAAQVPLAHVAQLLHLRHRLDPAGDHFRRRDHCHRAVAADHGAAADLGAAGPGHVSRRLLPDGAGLPHRHWRPALRHRACHP
jgi:ABC-type dipeptide/oligopeptide/nickel transport system permease component